MPPREGLPKIFRTALQVTRGIRNSQVTRVLHQLKIHWGCRFSGVPAARARGRRSCFVKFGTLVHLGNAYFASYEIRGCGALCACSARANHFHLLHFPPPTGQTVGTADARRAGHMYAATTYMSLWLPFVRSAVCARQDRKKFIQEGSSGFRKF